jgi:hypothetical protein
LGTSQSLVGRVGRVFGADVIARTTNTRPT